MGIEDAVDARAAIVTGAGNGLGAAFARALAAEGVAVLVNNRRHADRPHSATAVVQAIEDAGGRAVADGHSVDAAGVAEGIVAAALTAFGRLDVLVLNAGISGPAIRIGSGDTACAEVMATNFFANVRLVEAALPYLLASPAGRIVFVSSTGGLHGVKGRAAYAASKGAVNGWALSLAEELRRTAVCVNVLAPYAATNMTVPPGGGADPRLAPEHAAAALTWLCDPACTRTGEIWVAGASHVRAARAMESRAMPAAELPVRAPELTEMPDARSYAHAEAAFADFHAEVMRPS